MTGRWVIAVAASTLAPLVAHAEWYHREEAIMGTSVAVELWADDPALAQRAMGAVIDEMRHTDELMSTYKPESQVSRVNAEAALHPVEVDPTIVDVVDKALGFSRLSGGAFDITYASVGYLYDFRHHQHPDDAAISEALPGVDYRRSSSIASTTRSVFSRAACASTSAASRGVTRSTAASNAEADGHRACDGQCRRRYASARRSGAAGRGSSAFVTRARRARSSLGGRFRGRGHLDFG
jgi:hypothetical protein